VTADDVEAYMASRKPVAAPATVNREVIKLAQLLDLAGVEKNPARKVKRLPDKMHRIPRALTDEEIDRVLSAARSETGLFKGFAYQVILTYLYTGMRRNELLYMEWTDIDFDARRIKIQVKEEFDPKGGYSRVVGISKKLAVILSNLPHTGRFVFGGDQPLMTPEAMSHSFKRMVKNYNRGKEPHEQIPKDVHLHTLRHTYVTHLMEHGINPRRVQDRAGH